MSEPIGEKKKFLTSGGYIRVVDIHPESESKQPPIIILPGWAESLEFIDGMIKEVAKSGRRTIAIESLHIPIVATTETSHKVSVLQKSTAINDVVKLFGISNADVIAHSEGAVNAVLASDLDANHFRRLILVGPAGLVSHKSIFSLISKFTKSLLFGRILSTKRVYLRINRITSSLFYTLKHPLKTYMEIKWITNIDLNQKIRNIRNGGCEVVIVSGDEDVLFSSKELSEYAKNQNITIYIVKGGHLNLIAHPQEFLHEIKDVFI